MAGRRETSCLFCSMVNGTETYSLAHETEDVLALMDIQPVNPGHVLVVSKTHAAHLADLAPELGGEIFRVGMLVAAGLRRSGVRCEGVNLFLADGAAAGQEVFHVHLHVFPRFEHDGFGLRFGPDNRKRPGRAELERIAARLRDSITK
jgi:histidine triad (HIT) family protein